MGDLVVGLAKSVVDGVLTKAQAAIEEEAKLRKNAQRDLVFITGEFQMMQSFLNVANKEGMENPVVRTWVSQVRELAYDVEDCIEFVIHLDQSRATWWFGLVPSCLAPGALDQAVDEIEQVKSRVADVGKRNTSYNLSGSKQVVPLQQQPVSLSFSGAGGIAAANMLAEARDATMRQQYLGGLSHLITTSRNHDNADHHHQLHVISVWGADGDHGTTSIIREAYNDPEIRHSFECRAWVKLTRPFNPREFVRGFMAQAYANSSQKQQGATATIGTQIFTKMEEAEADLFAEFDKLIKKKYLVVLEDLSDMLGWDTAMTFLPDNSNGSCVLVSAQECEIASLCVGHPYQILELKQFSPHHSVCALFAKDSINYHERNNKAKIATLMREERRHESPYYSDTLLSRTKAWTEAEEWMKKNSPLIGRDRHMTDLRKYPAMARTSSNPVMAVWGIAGVGKSAVVRDLYYGRMLKDLGQLDNQFNRYGWVEVSQPFDLRKLCLRLLKDVVPPLAEESYTVEESCRRLVHDRRCLIVIDGLRTTEEWDLVQASLVPRNSASVIVVVTTEPSVASYCTNNEDHLVFNVKVLETASAIDLFKNKVHRRNPNSTLKVHGDDNVEDLVRRCGGLPKVIDAVAALMATRTVTLMETVCSLNARFMHHLETKQEYKSLRSLFHWMNSYFRAYPDSLKPCIIYLAIFRHEHIIRRRRLVRRWVAEGYSTDGHNESANEIGEGQFSELLRLSIIQQPPASSMADDAVKMVRCEVNGFIQEYIVSRQMEENLVFELGGRCGLTTQHTGRHLVMLDDWAGDMFVFKSIEFSRLRSLTVFGQWKSFFISDNMKMLRVLDLEDATGNISDSDIDKVVEHLRRLKFLSLRGHSEISRLPALLGYLRHLQTLDVRGTSVTSLPGSIIALEKLQYVRAGSATAVAIPIPWYRHSRWRVGVEVPRKSIRKLTALHTLGVANIDASGGNAMVKELRKLTQLRKLGASGINRSNSSKFFSVVSAYGHLESLSVQFDKTGQAPMDDIVLPWKTIHSLKLYGLQNRVPYQGRPSPEFAAKLTKLNLEMEKLEQDDDIKFLAELPKLCVLRLRVNQLETTSSLRFHVHHCGFELPSFQKVKILEIACSNSTLLQPTFGSKTMQSLELLKLDCRLDAEQLPQLNHLPQLKEVLLKRIDGEETKIALQTQLDSHSKKHVVKYFDM